DVDTGTAERLVHLDADSDEAELGGANRGDIAAGAAADDHDVGWGVRSHGGGARARSANQQNLAGEQWACDGPTRVWRDQPKRRTVAIAPPTRLPEDVHGYRRSELGA